MSNSISGFIPFSGDVNSVSKFYEVLGLASENGFVKIDSFELVYAKDDSLKSDIQFLVEVDVDLATVEKRLVELGGAILDDGFDTSGPFFVTRDPAGISVRVSLSKKGFAKTVAGLDQKYD